MTISKPRRKKWARLLERKAFFGGIRRFFVCVALTLSRRVGYNITMYETSYGEIVIPLLEWYGQNARDLPWRHTKDPYAIWLSEIMLQQTRVEAVKEYYRRFLEELPDVRSLAAVDEKKLLKLWEGLGYYTRARNLARAAREIVDRFDGSFPSRFEDIRSLPGIGDYTAGAIASIAFGEPTPAVDGNVLRVVTRVTGDDGNIDTPAVKQRIAEGLRAVYPIGMCSEFTQSLMELGACVCLPNGEPKCEACPLSALCMARREGRIESLPLRAPKRGRKIEYKTVFVLNCRGRVAVCQRAQRGLLAGMWQYPDASGILTEEQAAAQIRAAGAQAVPTDSLEAKHIFTHIEWRMVGYGFEVDEQFGDYVWILPAQSREEYPLPAAYRLFDALAFPAARKR